MVCFLFRDCEFVFSLNNEDAFLRADVDTEGVDAFDCDDILVSGGCSCSCSCSCNCGGVLGVVAAAAA